MSRLPSQFSDDLLDAIGAPPLSDPAAAGAEPGFVTTPPVPLTIADTGVDGDLLRNLALKLAFTVPGFTSDWAARKLRLPLRLTGELLEQLRRDQSLDMLAEVGPFNYRFHDHRPRPRTRPTPDGNFAVHRPRSSRTERLYQVSRRAI